MSTIRPASADDVPQLVSLRAEMFRSMGQRDEGPWRALAAQWFFEAVDDPEICIMVLDDDGTLLSCAMAELRFGAPSPGCPSGLTAYVSNVVTTESARGQGHADRLLAQVLRWCAEESRADLVELLASGHGTGLYTRYGFRRSAHPALRLSLLSEPDPIVDPGRPRTSAENHILPIGDGAVATADSWFEADQPVIGANVPVTGACEFCAEREATRTIAFSQPSDQALHLPRELFACDECHDLVGRGDTDGLAGVLAGNRAWQDVGDDTAATIIAQADTLKPDVSAQPSSPRT